VIQRKATRGEKGGVVTFQIVPSVGYTEQGHLSSVLKEEVREPEVIWRKSVPGPLSAQPGLYWGPLSLQQECRWTGFNKDFLSVILGTGFVGLVTASYLCLMKVS
jgi:hypothetical protein